MTKAQIQDHIVQLLENVIRRTEIINRQSGDRNLIEIDIAMEDLRLLYREFSLLKQMTEAEGPLKPVTDLAQSQKVTEVFAKAPVAPVVDAPVVAPPVVADTPVSVQVEESLKNTVATSIPVAAEPVQQAATEAERSVGPPKVEPLEKRIAPVEEIKRSMSAEPVVAPVREAKPQPKAPAEKPAAVRVGEKFANENVALGERLSASSSNSIHERLMQMKEDKSIGARLQQKPIENLKDAIGLNEKFLFINELFNGNIQAYNEAIGQLNSFPSIHEAFEFINSLTGEFAWDGNRSADTIEKFANLVQRRYIGN